jgi:hypothetical protein
MLRPMTDEFLLLEYTISTSSRFMSSSLKMDVVASMAGGMKSSFFNPPCNESEEL